MPRYRTRCSYYLKTGACRFNEACSHSHTEPTHSQTIVLPHFYQNPNRQNDTRLSKDELQTQFDNFYEDIFTELALKYGEIKRLRVCDNLGEHLMGNVYVQFWDESVAQAAVENLNQRYYQGRAIYAELSPVGSMKEATCLDYEAGHCERGQDCSFMHLCHPSSSLKRELYMAQDLYQREQRRIRRDHRTRTLTDSYTPTRDAETSRDNERGVSVGGREP